MPLFVPSMKYIYPMEIKFVTVSTVNYCINYIIQAVGYVEGILVFSINVLMFVIFSMNTLCELEVIAALCSRIGEYEEQAIPLVVTSDRNSVKQSTSYINILKDINEELVLESTSNDKFESPSNNIKSEVLLGVLVKYHANVLQ